MAVARAASADAARGGLPRALQATVSDDGVGFDREQLGSAGGLGLVMMRERAIQLNGNFKIASAPNRGTTITVVIPFR